MQSIVFVTNTISAVVIVPYYIPKQGTSKLNCAESSRDNTRTSINTKRKKERFEVSALWLLIFLTGDKTRPTWLVASPLTLRHFRITKYVRICILARLIATNY